MRARPGARSKARLLATGNGGLAVEGAEEGVFNVTRDCSEAIWPDCKVGVAVFWVACGSLPLRDRFDATTPAWTATRAAKTTTAAMMMRRLLRRRPRSSALRPRSTKDHRV